MRPGKIGESSAMLKNTTRHSPGDIVLQHICTITSQT
jgi:hypothetical protein